MTGRLRVPTPVVRVVALVRGTRHVGVYSGLALVLGGFVLIAVGWGRIAALHEVGLQLPYLASACFTGAGLVIVGSAVLLMSARATDASARRDQLAELAATLGEIRACLAAGGGEHARAVDAAVEGLAHAPVGVGARRR